MTSSVGHSRLGYGVGMRVGREVGATVGYGDGRIVGTGDGWDVGMPVGWLVGSEVGTLDLRRTKQGVRTRRKAHRRTLHGDGSEVG